MSKKKEKIDSKIVIAAIVGIVVLEGIALFKGVNGTLYSLALAAIAGLAGLVIENPFKKR